MVNNHSSDNVLFDIGSYIKLAVFPLFNKENCSGLSEISLWSEMQTYYLSISDFILQSMCFCSTLAMHLC